MVNKNVPVGATGQICPEHEEKLRVAGVDPGLAALRGVRSTSAADEGAGDAADGEATRPHGIEFRSPANPETVWLWCDHPTSEGAEWTVTDGEVGTPYCAADPTDNDLVVAFGSPLVALRLHQAGLCGLSIVNPASAVGDDGRLRGDWSSCGDLNGRMVTLVLDIEGAADHATSSSTVRLARALGRKGAVVEFAIADNLEVDSLRAALDAAVPADPQRWVDALTDEDAQRVIDLALFTAAGSQLPNGDQLVLRHKLKAKGVPASSLKVALKAHKRALQRFAPPRGRGGRPVLVVNWGQVRERVEVFEQALALLNAHRPVIVTRGGALAKILRRGRPGTSSRAATIKLFNNASLRDEAYHAMDVVYADGEGGFVPADLPKDVVATVLGSVRDQLFPEVSAITTHPVYLPGFRLLGISSFDSESGVLVEPPNQSGVYLPVTGAMPVDEARDFVLSEILVDFPFAGDGDRANAVGLLLLPVLRHALPAPFPLHALIATTPGSGKTYVADVLGAVYLGRPPNKATFPRAEDEARKQTTARLLGCESIVVLDNLDPRSSVNSPVLAALLTSERHVDRVLGSTRMVDLRNDAIWLATGNGLRFSTELTRRIVPIRLVPRRARPWLRDDFRHPDLVSWVLANRERCLDALISLVEHWIRVGKPRSSMRLGSYVEYAAVTGGILDAAGIPGFLGNLGALYAEADAETDEWEAFLRCWWNAYVGTPRRASELNRLCEEHELMLNVRGGGTEASQYTRLGNALQSQLGRIIGEWRIVAERNKHTSSQQYRLQRRVPAESAAGVAGPAGVDPGSGESTETENAEGTSEDECDPDEDATPIELPQPQRPPQTDGDGA